MPAITAPPTRIRFIRPFTKRVVNPITRRFAGRLPGFAILTHVDPERVKRTLRLYWVKRSDCLPPPHHAWRDEQMELVHEPGFEPGQRAPDRR
jgi:hypothetical protein